MELDYTICDMCGWKSTDTEPRIWLHDCQRAFHKYMGYDLCDECGKRIKSMIEQQIEQQEGAI